MTGPSTVAADVDAIAAAVLACPAVASLYAGRLSPVVTLLPGRRVDGVRVTDERVQIAVVAASGVPVSSVAEQVRAQVGALAAGRPVDVHIGDLQVPVGRPGPASDPWP